MKNVIPFTSPPPDNFNKPRYCLRVSKGLRSELFGKRVFHYFITNTVSSKNIGPLHSAYSDYI